MNQFFALLAARGASSFLRALFDLGLLAVFFAGSRAVFESNFSAKKFFFALSLVPLLTVLYCAEVQGTLVAYLYKGACYSCYCLFVQLVFGGKRRRNAYWVLCFYLVIDCTDTLLRHAGMRVLAADYLREGAWWMQLTAKGLWAAFSLALLLTLRRFMPTDTGQELSRSVLWATLLTASPYLFVRDITACLPLKNEQLNATVPTMLAASCMVALFSSITLVGRLNAEIAQRQALQQQQIMERQHQQYLLQKSSAETVQRNYHDLKNILRYLESASNKQDVQAYVRKVMGEVRPYETFVNTGNETIDILLNDKLALCQAEQIPCTVDVNGALLDFISPLDLCILVGNAMDNAIEACLKLPDTKARSISVKSAQRSGFVLFCVRNSFNGNLREQDGRLFTTKSTDVESHGFGLENMRRVVVSYDGEMSTQRQGTEFVLTLLFPLAAQKQNKTEPQIPTDPLPSH
jgi:hypothetical protein